MTKVHNNLITGDHRKYLKVVKICSFTPTLHSPLVKKKTIGARKAVESGREIGNRKGGYHHIFKHSPQQC